MEFLTSKRASEYLNEALPGHTIAYWQQWLTNNRNSARRAAYRIPSSKIEGSRAAHYSMDELEKFVEFEQQRQLGSITLSGRAAEALRAYGIGEKNGGLEGRKLSVKSIFTRENERTKAVYIQLVVDDPLMVFRLQLSEAMDLSDRLKDAVHSLSEEVLKHRKNRDKK